MQFIPSISDGLLTLEVAGLALPASCAFWVERNRSTRKGKKKFTIEQAITEILGQRQSFSRGDIEIQWITCSQQISNLVSHGFFKEKDNRLTRASLETFLISRWTGSNPT